LLADVRLLYFGLVISAIADCCFGAFYSVNDHFEHRSQNREEVLEQYLLSQTLSTILALKNIDELWSRAEFQVIFMMVQGRLIGRVFQQLERERIALSSDQDWYIQLLQSLMESAKLDNGFEGLQQVLGDLTPAKKQAITCALESVSSVQDLFNKAL